MKVFRYLMCAAIFAAPSAVMVWSSGTDTRIPPVSQTVELKSLASLPVSEVEAIDSDTLLAEDAARASKGPDPLRFAQLTEVALLPSEHGVWQELPDGGRLWRLRVRAPNATDLNLGFSRFRLPKGAMVHVISEADGFFQGPYTAEKNRLHGELWTAVIPGDRAVVELYVPAAPEFEPELELGWVGRGYRDLFRLATPKGNQGQCNIDVICPEGDEWRDEIRSVAMYSYVKSPYQYFCTGTLIRDVPESMTPYFLTAWHCGVDSSVDQSVVVYWNLESPTCGRLGGGSLSQNQTGVYLRASRDDADFALFELEDQPSASFGVYYSGWDARASVQHQGSVCIHHPQGDEKAISFNDDALATVASVQLYDEATGQPSSTVISPWRVDNWEEGTTEGGSSGSGLWDIDSHRIVGTLAGGAASCDNPGGADYYGKLSRAWDGSDSTSRLKDWLDPENTGTRFVGGSDEGGGDNGDNGDGQNVASCGNAFYDDGVSEGTAWFGGGNAGNPDNMFAVYFRLADFGFSAGSTQITKFCASNQNAWDAGPWPNQVFVYPDIGGSPDDSSVLAQGTVYTGDGLGWYEVTLESPVTLNGDFWLVMRGDARWSGEDFNMDFDDTSTSGQSLGSDDGTASLSPSAVNYMLRATLQESGNVDPGYGDGDFNYHLGAIVHSSGVGGAFFRTKMGVLNPSGSAATVTFTYFWNNGPTTVTKAVAKRTVAAGRLETWDDAALTLFGLGQNTSGSVLVNSTVPVLVTSRTYTSDDTGTFGSFMPGVAVSDGVGNGETGILSQLTGNSSFRTNVGVVNLSDASCQARVRVKSKSGANLGSPKTLTLGPYKFTQINDIFASTGAGTQNDAYATVEALTSGCRVWAYASVIDGTNAAPGTNDPTLIPMTAAD